MANVSTRPSVTFVVNLNPEELGLICDAICRPVGSQHHNDESPAYRQMREDLHTVLKTALVESLAAV